MVGIKTKFHPLANTIRNGSGFYFALGTNGYGIYSYDCVNWTSFNFGFSGQPFRIAYGNGRWVVTSYDGGFVPIYSDDGLTWNTTSMTTAFDVIYDEDNAVFAMSSSQVSTKPFWTSTDGETYTNIGSTLPISLRSSMAHIAYVDVNDTEMLAGFNQSASSARVGVTSQGAAISSSDANWYCRRLVYNKTTDELYVLGNFDAISVYSNLVTSSTNTPTRTLSIPAYGMIYAGGKYVALSNTTVYYSTDGYSWNTNTLPITMEIGEQIWSITYGKGRYVACSNNHIMYSSNGVNWTEATIPSIGTTEWYVVGARN